MDPNIPYPPPPAAVPSPGPAPLPPPPVIPPGAVPIPYVERKSAVLAGLLSMFPGLGHLYLGLYPRGLAFGGAFIVAISLARHRGEFFGPMIAFIWFFGLIDAVRQAHAINRGYVAESGFAPNAPLARRSAPPGTASLTWGVILVGIGALWLIDRYVDIDWSFLDQWGAPAAFILLGIVLIATHVRRKRRENEQGLGMPPRTS